MPGIVVSQFEVQQNVRDWQHLVSLMQDTTRDFEGATVTALPPRVHELGTAFVAAWAGYARESSQDAEDVVASLEDTLRDFDFTDSQIGQQLTGFTVGCPPPPIVQTCAMPTLESRLGDLP